MTAHPTMFPLSEFSSLGLGPYTHNVRPKDSSVERHGNIVDIFSILKEGTEADDAKPT